jgi:hypothetical protein
VNTRTGLIAVGSVLVLLGAASWVAPLIAGQEALVERTVETKAGNVTTTEKSIGWGAVHSEEMLIALLGGGLVFITLGALPPGSLKSVKTVFGEVEFSETTVKQVLREAAKKAPDKASTPDVYERAVRNLKVDHGGGRIEPTPEQIASAVERAVSDRG